eukprot:1598528-Rhodomonas_salina.5
MSGVERGFTDTRGGCAGRGFTDTRGGCAGRGFTDTRGVCAERGFTDTRGRCVGGQDDIQCIQKCTYSLMTVPKSCYQKCDASGCHEECVHVEMKFDTGDKAKVETKQKKKEGEDEKKPEAIGKGQTTEAIGAGGGGGSEAGEAGEEGEEGKEAAGVQLCPAGYNCRAIALSLFLSSHTDVGSMGLPDSAHTRTDFGVCYYQIVLSYRAAAVRRVPCGLIHAQVRARSERARERGR